MPASQRPGPPRTHPGGMREEFRSWYDPDRVYVMDSHGIDPVEHRGRFAFTGHDAFAYEVAPEDLRRDDGDVGAVAMGSATCARARVIRCVVLARQPL